MKKLGLFFCFFFFVLVVNAQSLADFYHSSANCYINKEKSKAKKIIEEALKKYPNDPKLKELAQKIDKLPKDPPPSDKKNQKQDPNKDKKDQQKQDKNKDNQDKKDQQQKQQPNPNQMSKQNAQQLLDAFMQDEKNTQDKMKQKQMKEHQKRVTSKDW